MTYASCVQYLLTGAIVLLSVGTLACLVRAIIGPKHADRLVAANMIGTQVICLICLIAGRNNEGGFVDVAIVYALLSFLAGTVLMKIQTGRGKKS